MVSTFEGTPNWRQLLEIWLQHIWMETRKGSYRGYGF